MVNLVYLEGQPRGIAPTIALIAGDYHPLYHTPRGAVSLLSYASVEQAIAKFCHNQKNSQDNKMPKKADIGGKRLISLAPDNWVRWVTQRDELEVREIIGSDFQWISRNNDSLIVSAQYFGVNRSTIVWVQ